MTPPVEPPVEPPAPSALPRAAPRASWASAFLFGKNPRSARRKDEEAMRPSPLGSSARQTASRPASMRARSEKSPSPASPRRTWRKVPTSNRSAACRSRAHSRVYPSRATAPWPTSGEEEQRRNSYTNACRLIGPPAASKSLRRFASQMAFTCARVSSPESLRRGTGSPAHRRNLGTSGPMPKGAASAPDCTPAVPVGTLSDPSAPSPPAEEGAAVLLSPSSDAA